MTGVSVSEPGAAAAVASTVPPSGDQSGVTDTNRMLSALSATGRIQLINGSYYVQPGKIRIGGQQSIQGFGAGQTIIFGVGGTAGQAVLTFRNPNFPTAGDPFSNSNTTGWSGGFTIDGSLPVTPGVHGIEIGDLYHVTVQQFLVREFNGAGSIGLRFNNTIGWTERIFVQGHISHAAQCVTWEHNDAGGGQSTPSFAYSTFILSVRCNNSQSGFSFRTGVNVYGGLFTLGGNFNASVNSANTGVALDVGSDNSGVTVQSESGSIICETNGSGANPQHTDCNIGTGAAFRLTGNVMFRGSNPWVAGSLGNATVNQFLVTGFLKTAVWTGSARNRKWGNLAVVVGAVANTPGAATVISPDGAQWQTMNVFAFAWTIANIGAETIQINITTTYTDGTTNTQTDTSTTNQTKSWNASQLAGMYKPNLGIASISITAQSTIGASAATVQLTGAGQNGL